MAREPIIIGLDESPIVLTWKGVDWVFNPDPPAAFLIQMAKIAQGLEAGELDEFEGMAALLAEQLTEPDQKKLWEKAQPGFAATSAILMAYIEELNNFPTPPSSESGEPHDGAGRK